MSEVMSQDAESEFDLREFFLMLWSGKWILIGSAGAFAVAAVIYSLSLPNIYRAEALLAPNQSNEAGGLSGLLSQYSGIAGVAGLGGIGQSQDKTDLGIATLRSRRFVADFIERRDILVDLLAVESWDAGTRELVVDGELYDTSAGQWVREVSPPKQVVPSDQEAYKAFSQQLSISVDKKTGFVSIAVEHQSPIVAKQWVDWVVADINSQTMNEEVERANQSIEYLNERILETSLADLRNVLFRLVEEQTKTIMLARVSPEYLFRTIDPAVVPELKARPKRAFIAIAGLLLGGLLGLAALLVRRVAHRRAPPVAE